MALKDILARIARIFRRPAAETPGGRAEITALLDSMKSELDGLGRQVDGLVVDVTRRSEDLVGRREALKRDWLAATQRNEKDRAEALARQIANLKSQLDTVIQQETIARLKISQVTRLRGLIEQTQIGLHGVADTPDLTATLEVLRRERERLRHGPLAPEFADACAAIIRTIAALMKELQIALDDTDLQVREQIGQLDMEVEDETRRELEELLAKEAGGTAATKTTEPAAPAADAAGADFARRELRDLESLSREDAAPERREME